MFDDFLRKTGDHTFESYNTSQDCPGIENENRRVPFPVINTLLSIPFSILHNLPRLGAMLPHSDHQYRLFMMATKIVQLWWWDPPEMTEDLMNAAVNHTPNPQPHPINHPSRQNITFESIRPLHYWSHHRPFMLAEPAIECLGESIHLWDETLPTKDDLELIDISVMAGITGSPVTSEAWTETEDEDTIDDIQDRSTICPSSFDIALWSQKVVNSGLEPLPIIRTPFEKGVIASMSVNDILMVKGLISPPVYVQFFDLALFS